MLTLLFDHGEAVSLDRRRTIGSGAMCDLRRDDFEPVQFVVEFLAGAVLVEQVAVPSKSVPMVVNDEQVDGRVIVVDGDTVVMGALHARVTDATEVGGVTLPPRQVQVLGCFAAGLSRKETAARLGISPSTVNAHAQVAYRSLGVSSRHEAVTAMFARGLLAPHEAVRDDTDPEDLPDPDRVFAQVPAGG